MKKHWKKLVAVLALSIVVILGTALLMGQDVKAGFGDFNDYDFDFDFDDFRDSGSHSDLFDGFDTAISVASCIGFDFFGTGIVGVFMVLVMIKVLKSVLSNRRKMQGSRPAYQQTAPVRTAPPVMLPDRTDEISNILQKTDPNFTAPDFISFAKQVYMDIQYAWMNRDLTPVKGVLHQNLYQQTQSQINQKIAEGVKNYLERISVNTAYMTSFRRDSEYEYLSVYLSSSMIDYQVREATGEILYGNRETRWNMFYKMTFMRSKNVTTRSAADKDKGIMCPNCGAPMKGISFGQCPYCDSIVLTGVYGWVLSDFTAIRNDTRDDGIDLQ